MKRMLYYLSAAFCILTASSAALHAQASADDFIYLKDGSEVKGKVLAIMPDRTVRIKTADSSIYVYQMTDVRKITMHNQASANADGSQADAFIVRGPERIHERNRTIAFYLGVAIPTGPFGDATSAEGGAATTGFAIGADIGMPLNEKSSVMLSVAYAANGMDTEPILAGTGITGETGSWRSLWTLIGIKGSNMVASEMEVYGFAQGGFFYGSSPEITLTPPWGSNAGQMTQNSSSTYAFGYAFGAGAQFGRFVLNIRYLAAKPEYELSKTSGSMRSRTSIEQSTACWLITTGIAF